MKLAFSRWLFNQIHKRNLIYNQCWEDPALDHEVLNIGRSDRIVMITSAGCNALDYLLRDPAEIVCVDVNPHQNALLELKLAALERLPYEQFFEMFGRGRISNHLQIYEEKLRDRLTRRSQIIWDRRIRYFDPAGAGLYFNGTAGWFARALRAYLHTCRGLQDDLRQFQRICTLPELSSTPELLNEEWRSIMRCAVPGARMIYRSGSVDCDYIPEFAVRRLQFQPARTTELNDRDRVGTYASFHFATVTP